MAGPKRPINRQLGICVEFVERFLDPLHVAIRLAGLPHFHRLAAGLQQPKHALEQTLPFVQTVEAAIDPQGYRPDIVFVSKRIQPFSVHS